MRRVNNFSTLVVLSIFAAVLACVFLGGCSGLTAKGPISTTIKSDADAARQYMANPTGDPAQVVAYNCGELVKYDAAKTTNIFAYLFGDKQILVNGEYATLLAKTAVLAAETNTQAATRPADWQKQAALKSARAIVRVDDARAGVKGN